MSKIVDTFRGVQLIADFYNYNEIGNIFEVLPAEAGFVDISTTMEIYDSVVCLIEIANSTEWALGTCTLVSKNPDRYSFVEKQSSPNFWNSDVLSGRMSSVQDSASFRGDMNGYINFNGAKLVGHWQGSQNGIASENNNLSIWADYDRLGNILLDANMSLSLYAPAFGFQGAMGFEMTVVVRQDAIGGWVVTLPSNFYPTEGSVISLAANAITILHFITTDTGDNWYYSCK